MSTKFKLNSVPGPLLQAHLDAGTIWKQDSEYLGKASDGVEVVIGDDLLCDGIESYLTEHPTPDTW